MIASQDQPKQTRTTANARMGYADANENEGTHEKRKGNKVRTERVCVCRGSSVLCAPVGLTRLHGAGSANANANADVKHKMQKGEGKGEGKGHAPSRPQPDSQPRMPTSQTPLLHPASSSTHPHPLIPPIDSMHTHTHTDETSTCAWTSIQISKADEAGARGEQDERRRRRQDEYVRPPCLIPAPSERWTGDGMGTSWGRGQARTRTQTQTKMKMKTRMKMQKKMKMKTKDGARNTEHGVNERESLK